MWDIRETFFCEPEDESKSARPRFLIHWWYLNLEDVQKLVYIIVDSSKSSSTQRSFIIQVPFYVLISYALIPRNLFDNTSRFIY